MAFHSPVADQGKAQITAAEEFRVNDKQHVGGAGLQVSSASVASVAESGGPPPAAAHAPAVGNEKQNDHLQAILKKVSSRDVVNHLVRRFAVTAITQIKLA